MRSIVVQICNGESMEHETVAFDCAVEMFRQYVAQIENDQWEEPTPDDDWSVHDLVRHNLEALLWVPDLLVGRAIAEVGTAYDGDIMGGDPKAAYRAAAERARMAVDLMANDLDVIVQLADGESSARAYLQHQTIDLTIHSWDLARAIGADELLNPELTQVVWRWFQPRAEFWRQAGVLKEAVPLGGEPDTQTRLLALSGRHA
jgi:uncharacterized protein (TIGR03086 family)